MNNSKNSRTKKKRSTFYYGLFFSLVLLSGQRLVAQSKFGIKASYEIYQSHPSSVEYSEDGFVYHNRINFIETQNGQALGLFYNKQFDFLFFQIDILYNRYQSIYKIDFLQESGVGPEFATEKFRNIDLALVAGYRFKNFDISIGPVMHRKMDFESQLSKFSFFTDRSKTLNMGFQFGLGYTWGPLRIETRIEDMFAKPGSHIGLNQGHPNKLNKKQNIIKLQFGIGF